MKKRVLLIIGIVLIMMLLISIILILVFFKKDKTISNIKSFSYGYNGGMEINSFISYKIKKSDIIIATIQVGDIEEKKVEITKEELKELEDILNKYKVGNWDGFKKYNKHIMDGSSFNINIKTEEGLKVEASGYMKWPNNYTEASNEIDEFFKKIYNKVVFQY